MAAPEGFSDKVAFVWKVADKLRCHVKPHDNCSVMLSGSTRNSRQHPRQGPPGSGDVPGGQLPH